MSWNPFLQNNKKEYSNKPNLGVVTLVVFGVVVGVVLLLFTVRLLTLKGDQDRVTTAAKKDIPDAKVSNVKVAGGFGLATVSDPTAKGQLNSGNVTVFKENKDKSMTQIASGSYFSPVDLLELGIPLATQAKLTEQDLAQIKQTLANTCNYGGGNTPGYSGFDGSFNPDGWQIDAATLGDIKRSLKGVVNDKNAKEKPEKKVICVNTTREKSNVTTDKQTYISTFTLELRFITEGGISNHPFTFTIGSNYPNYTLDGQKI